MDSNTILEPQNRSERTEILVFRSQIIEKITTITISETCGLDPHSGPFFDTKSMKKICQQMLHNEHQN